MRQHQETGIIWTVLREQRKKGYPIVMLIQILISLCEIFETKRLHSPKKTDLSQE